MIKIKFHILRSRILLNCNHQSMSIILVIKEYVNTCYLLVIILKHLIRSDICEIERCNISLVFTILIKLLDNVPHTQ